MSFLSTYWFSFRVFWRIQGGRTCTLVAPPPTFDKNQNRYTRMTVSPKLVTIPTCNRASPCFMLGLSGDETKIALSYLYHMYGRSLSYGRHWLVWSWHLVSLLWLWQFDSCIVGAISLVCPYILYSIRIYLQ